MESVAEIYLFLDFFSTTLSIVALNSSKDISPCPSKSTCSKISSQSYSSFYSEVSKISLSSFFDIEPL